MSYQSPPETSRKTLQNKVIDGGVATDGSAIYLPANTTVNLAENERKVASIAYDTTLEQVVIDKGAGFVSIDGGGGAGADTALSNLDTTEINVDLLPAVDISISLGSASLRFLNGNIVNLKDSNDITAILIEDRVINDATGISSINASSRELLDSTGAAKVQWNASGLILPGDNDSLAGVMYFSQAENDESISIHAPNSGLTSYDLTLPDAQAAGALTNDGAGNLSWAVSSGANTDLSNLIATSINQSLNPDTDQTYNLGGTGAAWNEMTVNQINSSAGTQSINVTNRRLFDNVGVGALRYTNTQRTLQDTSGNPGLDWGSRDLLDSSGTPAASWQNRNLADSGGNHAIEWDTRDLIDGSGNPCLNWAADERVSLSKVIRLHNLAADPGTALAGDCYFNTTLNKIKVYNGTTWETVTSV